MLGVAPKREQYQGRIQWAERDKDFGVAIITRSSLSPAAVISSIFAK